MDKTKSKTLLGRLKAETPTFWKRVRKLMITVGAIGAAVAALPAEHTSWIPDNLPGIMITVGTVGTVLASLTVKDNA